MANYICLGLVMDSQIINLIKMSSELQLKLDYVTACRESRLMTAQEILENKDFFNDLVRICFSPSLS